MQTTSAPMAWLFLQENVQVQYLQKIALRAENKWVQYLVLMYYFLRQQFSVAIEATIFRIERRAIEALVSNPFSPSFLSLNSSCQSIICAHLSDLTSVFERRSPMFRR